MLATFGAGCFWHIELAFSRVKGVSKTTVGFMGGRMKNPTYEDVCTDKTGHVEVCQIKFDPKKISYEGLLDIFWTIYDPTQVNRQGPDVGTQYRSVIFYHSAAQKKLAETSKKFLEKTKYNDGRIATEIREATEFYRAEERHQKYLEKRGMKTCPV